MGTSAQMQPRSKPTWLKVPLVPEEVTFITIRRRGMEKRAWRLKNRVGSMGTRTRSSMVRSWSGEKPWCSAMARYWGQRAMWKAQQSAVAWRKSWSVLGRS